VILKKVQCFYWHPLFILAVLVCKPILQAKWSNKQKTKVLCIKVYFVHFYLSNECCVRRHSFFPQLVCVCIFFHTPKAKTQNLFFLLGVGWDIICKRDRWWVYWLLIVYTVLLPWQFSTLFYFFFRNVEIFKKKKFPSSNKKILKENIERSRKFYLVEMIFQFIYLFDKHWFNLPRYYNIWYYYYIPPTPKTIWGVSKKKSTYSILFFLKWG
jgi:hypothetical protein